jgi:hypothetical protein
VYEARLIDHEGVTVKNIAIPGKLPRILTAVQEPFNWASNSEPSSTGPSFTYVEFEYEFTAGDGVRIYRRVTPLWKD